MEHDNSISHVVFDFDGTLLDMYQFCMKMNQQFFDTFSNGKQVTHELMKYFMESSSYEDYGKRLCVYLEMEASESQNVLRDYLEFKPSLTPPKFKPGVERLVNYLGRHGINMAIATWNDKSAINKLVKLFGDYFKPNINFSHIVCGFGNPEIGNNKPNPEIFINCVKMFEKQPKSLKNVLIIEDTFECAKNAVEIGMKAVLVNEKFNGKEGYEGLTVIKSLNDFRPEIFGLPEFD